MPEVQEGRRRAAGNRRVVLLCGVTPAILTVALALYRPSILAQVDLRVYDAMLRASPVKPPVGRVAIVDIDEQSLAAFGQWPWRRDVVGRLVSAIRDSGAAVVATDIVFAEPDRSDGSSTRDAELARVLTHGRVVLGYAFTFDRSADGPDPCALHPLGVPVVDASAGGADTPLFHATGVVCSLPSLATAAGASGFLNAVADQDGVLRRIPLAIEYKGGIYPSLALAAVSAATNTHPIAIRARNVNSASLALPDREVPLDGRGNLLVRYRGGHAFPHFSAGDVLRGTVPAERFSNAIVFVGSTALGARDVVSTPFERLFSGVDVQATAADNLLGLDFLARPEHALALEAVVVLIVGIGITLLVARRGLGLGSVSGAAALVVLVLGARWMLVARGEYFSPLFPAIGLLASLSAATVASLRQERGRANQASSDREVAQRLMIQSLLSLTEMRDAETGRHSRRTRQYARLLAERLAAEPGFSDYLTPDRVELLARLAPLHDIGKVGVPDQLLNKPGALTADEYREMKKHPIYGLDVITRAEREAGSQNDAILAMAKDIVYTHHERWDGLGYPQGLRREQIPIPGRLIALVDVYDALTTRRVYRQPMTHDKAVELIVDGKGTHFDPAVVNAFMQIAPIMRAVSGDPGVLPAEVDFARAVVH